MRLLPFLLLLSFTSKAQSHTIHFDFNKANIKQNEAEKLDSFLVIMQKENKVFSLFGHTDSKGSNAYNIALSQKRVNAVKNYLLKKGFDKKLLQKEKAEGETKLIEINDDDTAIGEINRRVEIILAQKKERTIKEIIEDTASKKGSILVLKNMNFEGGRHIMLPTSKPILQNLLAALKNNKRLKIAIEGHICCLEGNVDGEDFDTGTQDLSMQRAKAIYDYLRYAGIAENRLQYKGYGHSFPLYPFPENDENEKTSNRRVEIKIIDK
jgi:outer membrane protein OmpA-like peptidoglycan-associated protein